jgi:hypothetical protein
VYPTRGRLACPYRLWKGPFWERFSALLSILFESIGRKEKYRKDRSKRAGFFRYNIANVEEAGTLKRVRIAV